MTSGDVGMWLMPNSHDQKDHSSWPALAKVCKTAISMEKGWAGHDAASLSPS
jgi:hypothetical protein